MEKNDGYEDDDAAAEEWQRILEGKLERADSERPREQQRLGEVQAAGAPCLISATLDQLARRIRAMRDSLTAILGRAEEVPCGGGNPHAGKPPHA